MTRFENTEFQGNLMQCFHLTTNQLSTRRNRGNEPGDEFEGSVRSVFRFADTSNVGRSLLEGNKEHSDYDSAESIADSDLEDGEFRKMLASPLYMQGRGDSESSRTPTAPGKTCCKYTGERSKCTLYSS